MPTNTDFVKTAKLYTDAYLKSGYTPIKIDDDIYEKITSTEDIDGKLMRVLPYPENGGMASSEELLRSMHNIRTKFFGVKNDSEINSFEMWYENRSITFYFWIRSKRNERKIRRQIDAHFPNSKVSIVDKILPKMEPGVYAAGSELELRHSMLYPIRSQNGVRIFDADPYRSLTSELLSAGRNSAMIQILFKPAGRLWAHGGKFGYFNPLSEGAEEIAEHLRNKQPVPEAKEERKAFNEERQLAEVIGRQPDQPAYHVNVRILTIADEKADAEDNAWSLASQFKQSYLEAGNQTFEPRRLGGIEAYDLIDRMKHRRFESTSMALTIPELTGVAHIPNESIEEHSINWNNTQSGAGMPANVERFQAEFDGFETKEKFLYESNEKERLVYKNIDDAINYLWDIVRSNSIEEFIEKENIDIESIMEKQQSDEENKTPTRVEFEKTETRNEDTESENNDKTTSDTTEKTNETETNTENMTEENAVHEKKRKNIVFRTFGIGEGGLISDNIYVDRNGNPHPIQLKPNDRNDK